MLNEFNDSLSWRNCLQVEMINVDLPYCCKNMFMFYIMQSFNKSDFIGWVSH